MYEVRCCLFRVTLALERDLLFIGVGVEVVVVLEGQGQGHGFEVLPRHVVVTPAAGAEVLGHDLTPEHHRQGKTHSLVGKDEPQR